MKTSNALDTIQNLSLLLMLVAIVALVTFYGDVAVRNAATAIGVLGYLLLQATKLDRNHIPIFTNEP